MIPPAPPLLLTTPPSIASKKPSTSSKRPHPLNLLPHPIPEFLRPIPGDGNRGIGMTGGMMTEMIDITIGDVIDMTMIDEIITVETMMIGNGLKIL